MIQRMKLKDSDNVFAESVIDQKEYLLKIKGTFSEIKTPSKATSGNCGLDFVSLQEFGVKRNNVLQINTGIPFEIPPNYYGKIEMRSSLAARGLLVLRGVIDSDYRGPIKMFITNLRKLLSKRGKNLRK